MRWFLFCCAALNYWNSWNFYAFYLKGEKERKEIKPFFGFGCISICLNISNFVRNHIVEA